MYFSFIIPVYNRPDEVDELLQSLTKQSYTQPFEIVIVEDGSSQTCQSVINNYPNLFISYYYKANSGPGSSRNYGMERAKGNYFLILDSDCVLPPQYLSEVDNFLQKQYVDCFGGPDGALNSFSNIQKAINFAMTSVLTTGGIRGSGQSIEKFQPRSFNMGISQKAFQASGGFGKIHPGEDPDLSIRLWKLGFTTALNPKALVYHKRRIDWNKFYTQVNKFGKARPILNLWHPQYSKPTYWFPSLFIIGLVLSLLAIPFKCYLPIVVYSLYLLILFIQALIKTRSLIIASLSVWATLVQFYGYGTGFLQSYMALFIFKKQPQQAFPKLFFK